ncbi:MAG: hypothetical protein GEV06_28790, partial [Luteitalea sp.]|nr:hypothetical protein [Luteitalea sp.]
MKMREQISSLLQHTERHAAAWFASLDARPVCATATGDELRQMLGGNLPNDGIEPHAVTKLLAE